MASTNWLRLIRAPGARVIIATGLSLSVAGAAAARLRRPEVLQSEPTFESEGHEGGESSVVREPMAWGCSVDAVSVASAVRSPGPSGRTPIPPPALHQDLSDLKIGRSFPMGQEHNFSVLPEQLASIEQEFCKRDAELSCPTGRERELIVADLLQRTARIAARSTAGSAERQAAERVANDLRRGRLPIIQFHTRMRNGPTAGIIRFQEPHSGKWILGIAFAKDFASAGENDVFLDGVIVQETVHYDDLSYLPDPLRCYESNIEIRGHYAMIRYWMQQPVGAAKSHPRIGMVLRAGLGATSRRAKWYTYLNRVERTDFVVEDELVSLEFKSLAALTTDREDDQRFLGEIAKVVSSALGKATYTRSHVASLSPDSINANARVISAVSRLVPRIIKRYDRVRGDIKETDGTTRRVTMSAELAGIQRSMAVLERLIGVLAADPDFRRKSEFVGPE